MLSDVFSFMDRDKDLRISYREYMHYAWRAVVGDGDPADADREALDWFQEVFHAADMDGDGSLDAEETVLMDRITRSAFHTAVSRLQQTFAEVHDITTDGVDIAVVVELITRLRRYTDGRRDRAQLMSIACDIVDNEQLNIPWDKNFFHWLAKLLEAADLDMNGALDRDEGGLLLHLAQSAIAGNEAEDDYDEYDDDESAEDALLGTFTELDVDADGKIDKIEFINAALEADPSGKGLRRARELFSMADVNRNLSLDMEELDGLLKHVWAE